MLLDNLFKVKQTALLFRSKKGNDSKNIKKYDAMNFRKTGRDKKMFQNIFFMLTGKIGSIEHLLSK
jgi:hypothetical protein